MIWDEFLRLFRFCDEEDSAGYLTKDRSGKDQKIAQSTHENEYIKTRKTFCRNSKQFLSSRTKLICEKSLMYCFPEQNEGVHVHPRGCIWDASLRFA
ncbi:hypothetical protein QUW14_12360 [Bacteroides gallinaceum]|uniref:hypothetical protein n=1 Tax=Bacteroides gallinaceum TaxID=1462571 RepID=UPI0025A439D0|nr:hypothetical protein [Bacteroides gallinaceum]MDM8155088.1 hypothetical protein [Bacteroides gallinaceum]